MKKWLCLCLCAGLVFGASGCGNTAEPAEQTAQQTQEQEEEQKTEQEETAQETKKTVDADDFFTAINTGFQDAELPTLDTWTKEEKSDGTIMYKYILDGQSVDVSCEKNGSVCISYWGDPQSDLINVWSVSMLQAINYFEIGNSQSVLEQLQSSSEDVKVGFGENGNTYILTVDSVSSVSDRNNVSCILMIE